MGRRSARGGAADRGRARRGGDVHRAGIEIRLAPGWKTYWRYPGDSGVPPRFDFSGSRNVKSVDRALAGAAAAHRRERHLDRLQARRGVSARSDPAGCRRSRSCSSLKARLRDLREDLRPGRRQGRADAHRQARRAGWRARSRARRRCRRRPQLGADGALAIRGGEARRRKRVLVDVAAPDGTPVELFAEGPTPDWALPVPAPVAGAPAGQQRFAFELDGLPPNTKPDGATLTLTAVAGEQAIEVAVPSRLIRPSR